MVTHTVHTLVCACVYMHAHTACYYPCLCACAYVPVGVSEYGTVHPKANQSQNAMLPGAHNFTMTQEEENAVR